MDQAPLEEILVVFVTAPAQTATELARTLVLEKLVACVNIVPSVRSVYRWKGKIEEEKEAWLIMKTKRSQFIPLEARVKALHPYDVPEIIGVPITEASFAYRDWVIECTETG